MESRSGDSTLPAGLQFTAGYPTPMKLQATRPASSPADIRLPPQQSPSARTQPILHTFWRRMKCADFWSLPMKEIVVRTLNAVHIALVWLASMLIVSMVVVIAVNVFLRFVFDTGILWSEEIALLCIVWFVFISFGLGVRQRLHITLSILPRGRIPRWLDATLDILSEVIMIVVGLVMIIFGSTLVKFTMKSIMPATGWPSGIMYLALPFAGTSIVIESLLHLLHMDGRDAAIDAYLSGEGKASEVFGGKDA